MLYSINLCVWFSLLYTIQMPSQYAFDRLIAEVFSG